MSKATSNRIARLLESALMLHERAIITAKDLADHFNITERTVYRDMRILAKQVPITSISGMKGGYKLESVFQIDPMLFSDERNILLALTSDSLLSLQPGVNLNKVQQLLKSAMSRLPEEVKSLATKARSRIIVDSQEWYWSENQSNYFSLIKRAVMESHRCRLSMIERGTTEELYFVVNPLGLVWKGGNWYIIYQNNEDQKIDRARLSRIIHFQIMDLEFVYPSNFHLDAWWTEYLEQFGRGNFKVILKIFPPAFQEMDNFNWKLNTDIIKKKSYWLVHLYVNNYDWLIPLILSFAPDIIVVEPAELRLKLRLNLQATMRRLSSPDNMVPENEYSKNTDIRKRAAIRPGSMDPVKLKVE